MTGPPRSDPGVKPPAGNLPWLGRFVARHGRGIFLRKAAGACLRYLRWHANVDYDLETNGEARVLEVLARFSPQVIFDVGANVGDWSLAAAARCPTATIFAFEIVPSTFERLRARTGHLRSVRAASTGLSDTPGEVRLRHFDAWPALTTASEYPHPYAWTEVAGTVTTGDDFAAHAGVERIDLLKIDVEGMEEQVLAGFRAMLDRRAIDLVQFEYGRVNIVNHFLLRDAHALFRRHGYVVGKVYPRWVDFREYDLGDEDFLGPNFVACRSDRPDLLRALGPRA